MKPKTLLDKALAAPRPRTQKIDYGPEHAELALAWIDGRISRQQVNAALGQSLENTNVYAMLGNLILACTLKGLLKVEAGPALRTQRELRSESESV